MLASTAVALGTYLPFFRNALVPIRHLVNGTTIARATAAEITSDHVELGTHGVLLVKGLAANFIWTAATLAARSTAAPPKSCARLFGHPSESAPCAPMVSQGVMPQAVSTLFGQHAVVLGGAGQPAC